MLVSVTSGLLYVENRRLIDVFPESVKKVWKNWELRGMILLSLMFQIVLVLLGNRRKYYPRTRIRIVLWSAYLMADWVATVGLGIISRNSLDDHSSKKANHHEVNHELMSFWAPFLLLHLGGPDTITAYALEDNELWLRHLLALVVQVGVTLYIFLTAWPGSTWLPLLSILILNAGLIKYGERTWALRSANSEHLRDSMLTPPEPGPSYAKFMEEFTLKKAEGFHVTADEVKEPPVQFNHPIPDGNDDGLITKAFDLFETFKRLFVDLILSFQDRENSQTFFRNLNPKDAFHVIEIELGLAFDMFYTKAPVVYTVTGCITRIVSLSSTLLVLVGFLLLIEKSEYHKIDVIITYLLLAVGLILEIYAVIILLGSDWVDQWLINHNKKRDDLIIPFLRKKKKHWWSKKIAQYNLLSFCLEEKPALCPRIQRLVTFIYEKREKHRYKTYNKVSKELKDLIFNQFLKFTKGSPDPTALCTHRGSSVLKEYGCLSLDWTTKVEFDQSILIWHIATDLCYSINNDNNPAAKESKLLSDYMLYLLVLCPYMLPIGIGMIRFRDTCAEAREFFGEREILSISGKVEAACWKLLQVNTEVPPEKAKGDSSKLISEEVKAACRKLLQVNTEVPPAKVKGDRSKSVLFDACRVARELRPKEKKWEIVSHVWVEMLAYAATHCRGHYHAQQLRKGGELLTHVWLLMAHLGITEQFQIDQGHARAKLIIK